jgi:hypothetical protein
MKMRMSRNPPEVVGNIEHTKTSPDNPTNHLLLEMVYIYKLRGNSESRPEFENIIMHKQTLLSRSAHRSPTAISCHETSCAEGTYKIDYILAHQIG